MTSYHFPLRPAQAARLAAAIEAERPTCPATPGELAAFVTGDHAPYGIAPNDLRERHNERAKARTEAAAARADAVALPPDEPLPEGWSYGPWIVLADVPPETVVAPPGSFCRCANGNGYEDDADCDTRASVWGSGVVARLAMARGVVAVRLLHPPKAAAPQDDGWIAVAGLPDDMVVVLAGQRAERRLKGGRVLPATTFSSDWTAAELREFGRTHVRIIT